MYGYFISNTLKEAINENNEHASTLRSFRVVNIVYRPEVGFCTILWVNDIDKAALLKSDPTVFF